MCAYLAKKSNVAACFSQQIFWQTRVTWLQQHIHAAFLCKHRTPGGQSVTQREDVGILLLDRGICFLTFFFLLGLCEEVPKVPTDPSVCGQWGHQPESKWWWFCGGDWEEMYDWCWSPPTSQTGTSLWSFCRTKTIKLFRLFVLIKRKTH